mgnify:CR=1 FL=1
MKLIFSELIHLKTKKQERNIWSLIKFFIALTAMVTVYSTLFHFLMIFENREFSWITGFYWTLTVMSTLGFGDITFQSDLGKLFSIVVLLSGTMFMLILLPFTFIQFFYAPWVEAQAAARAPRANSSASVACSSTGSSVVWVAGRSWPGKPLPTVPSTAVGTRVDKAWARKCATLVLPLVPVTPTMRIAIAAWPKKRAAISPAWRRRWR